MKKMFVLWLCVLLVLPMALSSCNVGNLLDGFFETSNDGVTTTENPSQESTTPSENPPQVTPIETDADRYNRALALLDEGKLEESYNIFLSIKEYADVPTYLSHFVFQADEHTYQDFDLKYGVHYIYRYQYDECGRVLFTDVMDGETKVGSERFNEYDEQGHLIATGFMVGEARTQVTTYEYDEEGRPIRQEGPMGILGGVTVLEYDEDGNIIKVIGPEGDVCERTYDARGNVIEELYKTARGDRRKTVYEYNFHGDLVKRTIQDELDVYEYEYDEQGNKTKFVYDGGWYEWEYDDNGNKVKETSYHSASEFVTFSFTYDENGNMTAYCREDQTGITGYMHTTYDAYGNELERRYTDENGNLTSLSTHTGYKLYYNPNPQKPLPEEMVGKG